MEERESEILKLLEVIEQLEAIYAAEGNVNVKTFDLDRDHCDIEKVEFWDFKGERFVYIG